MRVRRVHGVVCARIRPRRGASAAWPTAPRSLRSASRTRPSRSWEYWYQPEDSPGWEAPRIEIAERMEELLADDLTVGMRTDAAAGWAGQVATWEQGSSAGGAVGSAPATRRHVARQGVGRPVRRSGRQLAVDSRRLPRAEKSTCSVRANRGPTVGKDTRRPGRAEDRPRCRARLRVPLAARCTVPPHRSDPPTGDVRVSPPIPPASGRQRQHPGF